MSKSQETVNLDDAIQGAYEAIQDTVKEYEKTNPPSTLPFNDRGNTKQIKEELENLNTLVQDSERSHTSTYGKSSYIESKADTIANLLPEGSKERDTIEAAQKVAEEVRGLSGPDGTDVEVDQNKAGALIAAQDKLNEKTGKSGKTHMNDKNDIDTEDLTRMQNDVIKVLKDNKSQIRDASSKNPQNLDKIDQNLERMEESLNDKKLSKEQKLHEIETISKDINELIPNTKGLEHVKHTLAAIEDTARMEKDGKVVGDKVRENLDAQLAKNEQQKENKPKKKISSRLMEQVKEIGKTAKEATKEAASAAKNKIQSIGKGKGNKKDGGMKL